MNNSIPVPHFAPPPQPTAYFEQAEALAAIFRRRPDITYRELREDYPEIDPDTIYQGLVGLFDDYLKRPHSEEESIAIANMFEASRQLEATAHAEAMQGFTAGERSDVVMLAASSFADELIGRPAGLACLFTAEAAISYESKPAPQPPVPAAEQSKTLIAQNPVSRYSILTDAISRNLPKLQQDANEVYVGRDPAKGARRDISSVVTMDFPPEIQVQSGTVLTSYDKAILNGISSLLLAGTTYFTIPMLYHAMTAVENPSMDAAAVESLRARLDLMRYSFITIDYTDEAAAHFIQTPVESLTIESYLLPLSRIKAKLNGREVVAYHVLSTPPLHQYATMKRQLSLVRMDLLNAPLNNNATTIPLKNYILARIEGMKNPHNRLTSNKILFQTLFEELGEPNPTKVRRKRIRDYAETYLQHLTAKQYIAGYDLTRSGKSIDGVIIRLEGKSIQLAEAVENADLPAKSGKIKPAAKASGKTTRKLY